VDASSTVLKYFNHSYLYVENEYGNTSIIEGHQQHDFTLSDLWVQLIVQVYPLGPYSGNVNQAGGYKNDDHPLTDSHTSNYQLTPLNTRDLDICDRVHDLVSGANAFNELIGGPRPYNPLDGPNSNSTVSFLLDDTGLTGRLSAPSFTPGWEYFIDHPGTLP